MSLCVRLCCWAVMDRIWWLEEITELWRCGRPAISSSSTSIQAVTQASGPWTCHMTRGELTINLCSNAVCNCADCNDYKDVGIASLLKVQFGSNAKFFFVVVSHVIYICAYLILIPWQVSAMTNKPVQMLKSKWLYILRNEFDLSINCSVSQ